MMASVGSTGFRRRQNTIASLWLVATVLTMAPACRDRDADSSRADALVESGAPSAATPAPERNIAPLVVSLGLPNVPPGAKSEPDPHWTGTPDAKVELDETFLLELGMGSGLEGLNVTTIAASGRASHVYDEHTIDERNSPHRWQRVDFTVTPQELNALVAMLNEQHFLSLPMRYAAPDVHDGAQWIAHVRTRAQDKYIYLDNVFPEPVVRLARFVSDKLIGGRRALRKLSRPYDLSHGEHLWRWKQWYEGCTQDLNPVDHDEGCMPLAVEVQLQMESGVPASAQYEITLVDCSESRRVLARHAGLLDPGSNRKPVWLTVRYDGIDFRHRYEVEARVRTDGRAWVARPEPVMTYGAPYGVALELRESADGG